MTTTSIWTSYQAGIISHQQIKQQNDITYRRIGQMKVFEWPDLSNSCDPDLLKPAQLMNVWHSGVKVAVRLEGCNHRLCGKDGHYAAVCWCQESIFWRLVVRVRITCHHLHFQEPEGTTFGWQGVLLSVSVCSTVIYGHILSYNFTINTTNTFFLTGCKHAF